MSLSCGRERVIALFTVDYYLVQQYYCCCCCCCSAGWFGGGGSAETLQFVALLSTCFHVPIFSSFCTTYGSTRTLLTAAAAASSSAVLVQYSSNGTILPLLLIMNNRRVRFQCYTMMAQSASLGVCCGPTAVLHRPARRRVEIGPGSVGVVSALFGAPVCARWVRQYAWRADGF